MQFRLFVAFIFLFPIVVALLLKPKYKLMVVLGGFGNMAFAYLTFKHYQHNDLGNGMYLYIANLVISLILSYFAFKKDIGQYPAAQTNNRSLRLALGGVGWIVLIGTLLVVLFAIYAFSQI